MKCKQMKLDGQGIADFLRDTRSYDIAPKKDIPKDLEMLSVERLSNGDHAFDNTFIVLFHSEAWPDIPTGTPIPLWEPVKKKQ